jgi:hypothetical protein
MKQVIALAWLLSALPVAAQQVVPVRSGEHDGFSRLVLQVAPGIPWQVVESRGLAALRFPDHVLSFDTARVFDRISHARIAEISQARLAGSSELQLKLNCKCKVQNFVFNKNYIVLDVYDGPALVAENTAANTRIWQPDALPFIQPPQTPQRFTAYVMDQAPAQPKLQPDPPRGESAPPPAMAGPSAPESAAQVAAGSAADNGVVADMEAMAGEAVSKMNSEVTAEDDPDLQARIKDAQNQLLEQLTRAAEQGLVDFVPAPAPAPAPATTAKIAPVTVTIDPAPPEPSPELMQQLSAHTVYGQGADEKLSEVVNRFAMPQCLDDSAFSMEDWGAAGGFSAGLADLRSKLFGEFDTPDPEIANKIVRLYLRYGFGAEALMMVREAGIQLENAALYNDLANIIEGRPARVNGPVLDGAGCGGAHEMWYLASGRGSYQVLEPLAITDVFSSYPIEVRTLIGPLLAQAFIDRGQVEAGHLVLEIVRRAESGVTPAQRMAEAGVLEVQGDMEGAVKIYRDLARAGGEAAPDALIAYARTLISTDRPVPDTLLVDLESAAFLNRNTARADSLKLWEIKVRAQVEGPDAALAQIKQTFAERPQLGEDLTREVADIFEHADSGTIGDYAYAQMVLRYGDMLDQGAAGDAARLKIAREMTAIGLPETALDMLAPNLQRPGADTRQIQAAAYVQLFQPARALEILKGDDSLAAYKTRLNAYLQLEDYAAVAKLLNQDYAKEISLNDVALRAGDWEKIKDAGVAGTLASYMRGGAQAPDAAPAPAETLPAMAIPEAPSLKAARDLLAENQQSVQILNDVLAAGQ